jgi:hypothetical protein
VDLEALKIKKSTLERNIARQLLEFETETGATIVSINIVPKTKKEQLETDIMLIGDRWFSVYIKIEI